MLQRPHGITEPYTEAGLKASCAQAALALLESPCTQSFLFIWLFSACDSPYRNSLQLSAAAAALPVTSHREPEEAALSSLCFFKLSFSTSGGTSLKSLLIPTGNGAKRKNHFPQTFSFPRATGRLSSTLSIVSYRNKTSPNPACPLFQQHFLGLPGARKLSHPSPAENMVVAEGSSRAPKTALTDFWSSFNLSLGALAQILCQSRAGEFMV